MAQTRNTQQQNPASRGGLNREQIRRGMGQPPAATAAAASRAAAVSMRSGGRRKSPGVVEFLRSTRSELRKVTWPSVPETRNLTIVVIAMAIVVGGVLGACDFVFQTLFKFILGLAGQG